MRLLGRHDSRESIELQPHGVLPAGGIAVDRGGGDVYVSDGEEPVAIIASRCLTENGRFLRQWVLHRTKGEMEAGEGDEFMQVPHCVAIGNDGWCTYATDGATGFRCSTKWDLQKDILILTRLKALTGQIMERELNHRDRDICRGRGAQPVVGFSPDQAQRFMLS